MVHRKKKSKLLQILTVKKTPIVLVLILINKSTALAQGRWSLGLELTRRSELRKYEDSYQYLFTKGGGGPVFPIGVNVAFQYSERWRFESGLISTPYSRTVGVYFNEQGYRRLLNKPIIYSGHRKTIEIPLTAVYKTNFQRRSLQLNIVGGLNTYILDASINASGFAGLPAIPVSPAPPLGLTVQYNDRNLSKYNISLEAGTEVMWSLGNRFLFIYRFTGRVGFIDMVEMEGNYITFRNTIANTENTYPFRVVSSGSALHHTFSLRYRMGKKKERDNWWEYEN
jgi:hypothetical protein